jgi:hypothetical protein
LGIGRGVSGTFPAFGPRFRNNVEYAGTRKRHLLVRYRDRQSFSRRLKIGHYDVLLVGRLLRDGRRALKWAIASGWRPVASDDRFTVLRPPGPVRAGA